MYAAFRRLGSEKTQSAQAPLWVFLSATFFCALETASRFLLIGHKKTSYTAGTLGEIKIEIFGKYYKIMVDKRMDTMYSKK
jgi:hypothetical protein